MKIHHLKHGVGSVNGMFNGSIRTKSITIIVELCFADWFHDLLDTLLYQLSHMHGIPSGRVFPFGFGISFRLTGFGL